MEQKKPVKISVEIFGDTYPLKTDGDPDYIRKLARMVDQRMKSVAHKTRSFSGNRIGVLAALELADDYCRLKKDYDDLMQLLDEK